MADKTFRKHLWRSIAGISVLAMLLTATACKSKEAEPTIEVTKVVTLELSSVIGKPGDKNVEVTVDITGNYGILGMDFDVYYDDTVVTLTDAKSQLNVEGSSFTEPAYYRNPTTFLWDFQDASWTTDGTILTLYFDIAEDAEPGAYEIELKYSYGNIFDDDGEPIDVKVRNAIFTVEEK